MPVKRRLSHNLVYGWLVSSFTSASCNNGRMAKLKEGFNERDVSIVIERIEAARKLSSAGTVSFTVMKDFDWCNAVLLNVLTMHPDIPEADRAIIINSPCPSFNIQGE